MVINQSIIIFIFVLEWNTINLPCGNVEGENGVVENFDAMKKRLIIKNLFTTHKAPILRGQPSVDVWIPSK